MYCSEGSHSGTLMYGSEGSHSGTLMYGSEGSHCGTLMYGSEGSHSGSVDLSSSCNHSIFTVDWQQSQVCQTSHSSKLTPPVRITPNVKHKSCPPTMTETYWSQHYRLITDSL